MIMPTFEFEGIKEDKKITGETIASNWGVADAHLRQEEYFLSLLRKKASNPQSGIIIWIARQLRSLANWIESWG
jgi:hypothetical protein